MTRKSGDVSISELERLTGKDRDTITKRLADTPHRVGPKNAKLFNRKAALEIILAGAEAKELTASKARKELADAEKAELLVAKLKGELVSVTDMKSSAAELIKILYTRTVRVLPSVVAPELVGKSAVEIEAVLRTKLAEVYDELKTMPNTFLTVEESDIDIPISDEPPE